MYTWDNNKLPILQLGGDFYDEVEAAKFPQEILRYWNSSLEINFEKSHFVKFTALKNNLTKPLALRYHGHQFQHYNPELGDGRGFLFAQLKINNQWYDLGTKGSGQTPYSRSGDGRLTLKGAMREALATELLESLGVNTSKTLCFFETGEKLSRNDEPSPTRSAVLTRFTTGHIRIGTFQRLAYLKQTENIKKLTSYCLNFYYHEKSSGPLDVTSAAKFLQLVVNRNAALVAQVMMAGFVHGVLNTDNINIAGELFDYGPYRFIPGYDPDFTAAYFDHQGLYSFGRQPVSFLWALHQLAESLKLAFPSLIIEPILETFSDTFNSAVHRHFFRRLNLKIKTVEKNSELISEFFGYMESQKFGFEEMFFDFHSKRVLEQPELALKYAEAAGLLQELAEFEIENPDLEFHEYFMQKKPTTLLIDEIESIWASISENDDWGPFAAKLQSLRQLRGIY